MEVEDELKTNYSMQSNRAFIFIHMFWSWRIMGRAYMFAPQGWKVYDSVVKSGLLFASHILIHCTVS